MVKKVSCVFLFVAFLLLSVSFGCKNKTAKNHTDSSDSLFRDSDSYIVITNKGTQPSLYEIKSNIHVVLDSLSSVKVRDRLKSGKQLLRLDGKGQFSIDNDSQPVVIYTGMMKLSMQAVDFQINAYSSSPGQSLKVFSGQLIATKSYPSDFPNTDTIHKGEMILINRDIDLMEKETFDTAKASH